MRRYQDLVDSLINDPDPSRVGQRAFAQAKADAKGYAQAIRAKQRAQQAEQQRKPTHGS